MLFMIWNLHVQIFRTSSIQWKLYITPDHGNDRAKGKIYNPLFKNNNLQQLILTYFIRGDQISWLSVKQISCVGYPRGCYRVFGSADSSRIWMELGFFFSLKVMIERVCIMKSVYISNFESAAPTSTNSITWELLEIQILGLYLKPTKFETLGRTQQSGF